MDSPRVTAKKQAMRIYKSEKRRRRSKKRDKATRRGQRRTEVDPLRRTSKRKKVNGTRQKGKRGDANEAEHDKLRFELPESGYLEAKESARKTEEDADEAEPKTVNNRCATLQESRCPSSRRRKWAEDGREDAHEADRKYRMKGRNTRDEMRMEQEKETRVSRASRRKERAEPEQKTEEDSHEAEQKKAHLDE
ncbi:hypothetical protein BDV98DRAFT_658788 [Pterulicium gracile]|uniref:Uncharacterized protein n=1 Tax=Pterulicium gracile TaxID=1884261 RepID=A0A5C3Q685_9AGAR|nr:hypothetical protein BDV98DRAFT_658788 [Pterula gracilis]